MAQNKLGKRSIRFANPVAVRAWASVAGKKEAEGPLGAEFDFTDNDTYFGQASWELAEKAMQEKALDILAGKAGMRKQDFELVLSGDLLNQCIGSAFTMRNTGIPHIGLYGACSTMALSMLTGSMSVSGGFADRVVAMTSSHFAASERQYRFPLGYGGQRTPTAQWTVTGSGAVLLCPESKGIQVPCATYGVVTDFGIKDAANMGCAMAPAALETIRTHLEDTKSSLEDFDCIFTGDLGQLGKEMLMELASREGLQFGGKLMDCGNLVFDNTAQDVHAGGSGCGCSAIVLCSRILGNLQSGKWKRVLFCGTGALLSPTSTQQGLPIPGVCHAVRLEGEM